MLSVCVSEAQSIWNYIPMKTFTKCVGHRGCSAAVTDGDVKPSALIHTQALASIFLTLPPINSATSLFSVIRVFLVSQQVFSFHITLI